MPFYLVWAWNGVNRSQLMYQYWGLNQKIQLPSISGRYPMLGDNLWLLHLHFIFAEMPNAIGK